MDNQEPELTQIANLELLHSGHKLPEQSQIPNGFNVNPTSFNDIIHQWQPMGIRVNLNLPFSGNDKDFLFAIRNGPFIPQFDYYYTDFISKNTADDPEYKNYSTRMAEYAYNNMMPVTYAYSKGQSIDPDKSAIFITHYDQPPPLASFATMFRKWRGTMHYRVRVVAGFTTQGYIFSTMYRNVRRGPMVINRAKYALSVVGQDSSYRQGMVNSYIMGDTAMFRHFEVQVPFEYPQPYYDQFNWIANRTRPLPFFKTNYRGTESSTLTTSTIYNEPFGDNFILFGLRGKLESSVSGSQISFELEYRAGDDFQFSDPFLPIDKLYLKLTSDSSLDFMTSPSKTWDSTGYNADTISKQISTTFNEKIVAADEMTNKLLAIKLAEQNQRRDEQIRLQQEQERLQQMRDLQRSTQQRTRKPRSVDEVDDDEEGKTSESLKPLRKSLRDALQF